jgi:glycosyltransferase involved in cell wall biosynthesis
MGKGAAIHTGFCYASTHHYDFVITIDGDGQHNPDEIPQLLDPLVNGSTDISLGFRSGDQTEMPKWRKLGKRILDYATSFANGGFITDSQCGFRGFNRNAIESILPNLQGNGFSVESEQLIFAHDSHLSFQNIRISCKYQDLHQTSKEKPAIHGFYVLFSVFLLLLKKRPLVFLGILGFLLISFAGVLLLYSFQENTAIIQIATILQWMTGFVLFLGLSLMTIGIIFSRMKRKVRRVVC